MCQNAFQPVAPSSDSGLVQLLRDVLQTAVEQGQVERDADPDVHQDDRDSATSGEVSHGIGVSMIPRFVRV